MKIALDKERKKIYIPFTNIEGKEVKEMETEERCELCRRSAEGGMGNVIAGVVLCYQCEEMGLEKVLGLYWLKYVGSELKKLREDVQGVRDALYDVEVVDRRKKKVVYPLPIEQ